MASEARQLLDDQIAALKQLREVAKSVYLTAAAMPAWGNFISVENAARKLAFLVTCHRKDLDSRLELSGHWLKTLGACYVPDPIVGGDHRSACHGAFFLVMTIDSMIAAELGTEYPLQPVNAGELASAIDAKWSRDGVPGWVRDSPLIEYEKLSETVNREIDASIEWATDQFRMAVSSTRTSHGDAASLAGSEIEATLDNLDELLAGDPPKETHTRPEAGNPELYDAESQQRNDDWLKEYEDDGWGSITAFVRHKSTPKQPIDRTTMSKALTDARDRRDSRGS